MRRLGSGASTWLTIDAVVSSGKIVVMPVNAGRRTKRSSATAGSSARTLEDAHTFIDEQNLRTVGAVEALAERVAELKVELTRQGAGDHYDSVGEVFAAEVRLLLGGQPPDPDVARRAARMAVAEQAWTERLGTLLDTRDVVDLLAVSKQRVSTLVRQHRLIALPQGGRVRFPAWQFALTDPADREVLANAHALLVRVGGVSPWSAASWLQAEHPELDGMEPIHFLLQEGVTPDAVVVEGGRRELLRAVAERDASRLAQ